MTFFAPEVVTSLPRLWNESTVSWKPRGAWKAAEPPGRAPSCPNTDTTASRWGQGSHISPCNHTGLAVSFSQESLRSLKEKDVLDRHNMTQNTSKSSVIGPLFTSHPNSSSKFPGSHPIMLACHDSLGIMNQIPASSQEITFLLSQSACTWLLPSHLLFSYSSKLSHK